MRRKTLRRGKLLLLTAAVTVVMVHGANAQAQSVKDLDHKAIAVAALDRHIRPGFANLGAAFGKLSEAAQACSDKEKYDFARLKPAFTSAVLAWGRVAHLNFGPLAQENRYERVYFWLDRKGIGRRQVARALRKKPAAYLDPAELGTRSIAVQGLPALEHLLTLPPSVSAEDTAFRCGYAQAIAGNLVNIATAASMQWSAHGAWAKWWLNPGQGNPRFLQAKEPTYLLVRTYMQQIERVRDVELLRPLGFAVRQRKLPGPFAKSALTMPFLAARISGLRDLMADTGLAAEVLRVAEKRNAPKARHAINQVQFELEFVSSLSAKLAKTPKFFSSPKATQAIALGFPLKSARVYAQLALSLTSDLPMGFNASDGD